MISGAELDLSKSYSAIRDAAQKHRFLSYVDIAAASGVPWATAHRRIPQHLMQLVKIAQGREWPILTAIVVKKGDLATGLLQGSALEGFLAAARNVGLAYNDPNSFLREQQEKVFAWAQSAPVDLGVEIPLASNHRLGGPRFVAYFRRVIDALRALGGEARPREVCDWILKHEQVPDSEAKGLNKSGQTKFENMVAWARFYLSKSGLIDSSQHGVWALTGEGKETFLDHERAVSLFKDVQARFRVTHNEDDPAPTVPSSTAQLFNDPMRQFWFGGAVWARTDDQIDRFLKERIWQNRSEDRFSDLVDAIKPGDRIAIKSSFVRKLGLPFEAGGKPVSCMRLKATGTVIENIGDRRTVRVEWDPIGAPRDWYFYTYRTTLIRADRDDSFARRLILFAFAGAEQDYEFFLKQPYFLRKYGPTSEAPNSGDISVTEEDLDALEESSGEPTYSINSVIDEGCFLPRDMLEAAMARLKAKKNLILQGPPGTGKTWLAKRLGYALLGSKDRSVIRSRLRTVQFHPSLSYEDFVRGWRPHEGNLGLVDGVFLEAVQAALSEPDLPFVLIIEEINRGNPAQVFGEMLTLLEDSKRRSDEAIELAYRRAAGERVHIPPNLHVIGTMNIADRSLAIVDLALRRRFAFIDLQPQLGTAWREWCRTKAGLDEETISLIEERISALNHEIEKDRSLGPKYRIGHSYVTPLENADISNPRAWFRQVIDTEIVPLLREYWFDAEDKADEVRARLLHGLE